MTARIIQNSKTIYFDKEEIKYLNSVEKQEAN